jgi:hypothetical protein
MLKNVEQVDQRKTTPINHTYPEIDLSTITKKSTSVVHDVMSL